MRDALGLSPLSNLRNVDTKSLDGYEISLMDNKKIILIDGIKNGKSHASWETITIEAAEKLACDLLDAVFDATETPPPVTNDWKKIDSERWEKTKNKLIDGELGSSLFYRVVSFLSLVDYHDGNTLNLICDNDELLKSDYAMNVAREIFRIEDGFVCFITMSSENHYREFSL